MWKTVNFISVNQMYNIFNVCAPNYLDSFHHMAHTHNKGMVYIPLISHTVRTTVR